MRRLSLTCVFGSLLFLGCSPGGPKTQVIEISEEDFESIRPLPIERIDVSSDDRRAVLHYTVGPPECSALARVEAVYSETEIVVTLYDGSRALPPGVFCRRIGYAKTYMLELAEEAGGRKLVDGFVRET